MNPFQHSAVAALIYEVFAKAYLRGELRVRRPDEEDFLGDLACTIAEVLAEKRGVKLGKPPDDITDWLDDPRCVNRGFVAACLKASRRHSKSHARGQGRR